MAQSVKRSSLRKKRGRKKVEPSSRWGLEHRDPLVERQELSVDLGMSEREWEAVMNIARTEQVAPELSAELDVRLKQRFGPRMLSYQEFWDRVKAVAVTENAKQGKGDGG